MISEYKTNVDPAVYGHSLINTPFKRMVFDRNAWFLSFAFSPFSVDPLLDVYSDFSDFLTGSALAVKSQRG